MSISKKEVTIVNYGIGNIWSVIAAFEYLGAKCNVTDDKKEILSSKKIVLPGVGSFKKAMDSINNKNLNTAINEAVKVKKSSILGICLGMQLIGSSSTENGFTKGLGLIPNKVRMFDKKYKIKIPHVGFNTVQIPRKNILFKDIPDKSDFYFVHSYYMINDNLENGCSATTKYGVDFVAAFEKENIFGTQFHPEKSQTNGLTLLRNFLLF